MTVTHSDFSGLATSASEGLTAMIGVDLMTKPEDGITSGLTLCAMLIDARHHKLGAPNSAVHDDEPMVLFAIGVLTQDLPPSLIDRLADEAEVAQGILTQVRDGGETVNQDKINDMAEMFARFAIVLGDYGL